MVKGLKPAGELLRTDTGIFTGSRGGRYDLKLTFMFSVMVLHHSIRKVKRIVNSKYDSTLFNTIGNIIEHILKEKYKVVYAPVIYTKHVMFVFVFSAISLF